MTDCPYPNLAPSTAYSDKKCRCSRCREWKKSATAKHSERAREKSKRWYAENKERAAQQMKEYREHNKEQLRESKARYTRENKEKIREAHLKRKYGLTLTQHDHIRANQENKCKICGEEFTEGIVICVDHCHETGQVRGLLCTPCNVGIGMLKHSPVIVSRAFGYLTQENEHD